MSREYERETTRRMNAMPFGPWLRRRCLGMTATEKENQLELMALTLHPSKKVCAFGAMSSFGSHYRVDMEEAGARHVTYDSGVAELERRVPALCETDNTVQVDMVRVGVLKNIWVLKYVNLNIVLMVVSWVAEHTDDRPRLRRDEHGFWLANIAARPRDVANPYLLPARASQVKHVWVTLSSLQCYCCGHCIETYVSLTMQTALSRYFLCRKRQCQGGVWF